MTHTPIPFVDLGRQYRAIRDEVHAAIDEVLSRTAFIRGFAADAFQNDFARYLGAKRVVGCNSGTDALWLAVKALGIGPGDEVLIPANTFFATPEAVAQAGATPVFVDCDAATFLIDLADAEKRITPRTKAIIPVHLYGQPCDMDAVQALCSRHRLVCIDDAAQAHGAEWKGHRIGSSACGAAITAFSFYPGKNLGAYGDAGAISTDRDDLADAILTLADHGQARKYEHAVIGWNSRLDGLQAAVLGVKLRHLDAWTDGRRRAAAQYGELLHGVAGLVLPSEAPHAKHVWHLYVVQVQGNGGAAAVSDRLRERGVQSGFHYPVPCHKQPAFAHLPTPPCPVAERQAATLLSLPMFGEITADEVSAVCEALKASV
ncbi:MAG: DegT/DnrJ/EryC1/StrS family aminotransferase [Planctomycetota bacterium]